MAELAQFYWGGWCFPLGARLGNARLSLTWIPAEPGSSWDSRKSPNPALTCAGIESALGQLQLIFP